MKRCSRASTEIPSLRASSARHASVPREISMLMGASGVRNRYHLKTASALAEARAHRSRRSRGGAAQAAGRDHRLVAAAGRNWSQYPRTNTPTAERRTALSLWKLVGPKVQASGRVGFAGRH
jgi:hypothetical protein